MHTCRRHACLHAGTAEHNYMQENNMHLHTYIYIYTHIHICIQTHMYTCVYVYVCTYANKHIYIHIYIYVYVCATTGFKDKSKHTHMYIHIICMRRMNSYHFWCPPPPPTATWPELHSPDAVAHGRKMGTPPKRRPQDCARYTFILVVLSYICIQRCNTPGILLVLPDWGLQHSSSCTPRARSDMYLQDIITNIKMNKQMCVHIHMICIYVYISHMYICIYSNYIYMYTCRSICPLAPMPCAEPQRPGPTACPLRRPQRPTAPSKRSRSRRIRAWHRGAWPTADQDGASKPWIGS